MHFQYRTCSIDVTHTFSLGRYFACARIDPCQDISETGLLEMHDSGDLGDFAVEADAIAYAHEWAIAWIEEHLNPVICRMDKDESDRTLSSGTRSPPN